ncbi:MAG: methionyl-tRNA formyltransferase [Deltaproteobacteria bacterium]|nr:methionyl-tRNA formyltransferase [Deltaproteobacteria bacterium]
MSANKLRCVFMGTPTFAIPSLLTLSVHPLCNMKAVFTQPDRPSGRGKKIMETPVKTQALKLKIPVFQFPNVNYKESLLVLQKIAPELIFVVAFGQLLSSDILELPTLGCFNAHASLLPKYRGAAPIQWALIQGEKETGVSIIKLIKKMDAGPIVLQKSISISSDDTYQSIHDQLSLLSAQLLSQTLDLASKHQLKFKQQDNECVSFAAKLTKQNCEIKWNQPCTSILNLIRGLNPSSGAFTYLQAKRLKIFKAAISPVKSFSKPGTIESWSPQGILVHTMDFCILVTEVQLENKKRIDVSEFVLGVKAQKGIVLGGSL